MSNKKPLTSKEVAAALAAFIVRSSACCPVDSDVSVPDCEGWRCEQCEKCIRKHANKLMQ